MIRVTDMRSGYRIYASHPPVRDSQILVFHCMLTDDVYEPLRRPFMCDKGRWEAQGHWTFENNGTFPECRKGR